jgi:hypothetical protein
MPALSRARARTRARPRARSSRRMDRRRRARALPGEDQLKLTHVPVDAQHARLFRHDDEIQQDICVPVPPSPRAH